MADTVEGLVKRLRDASGWSGNAWAVDADTAEEAASALEALVVERDEAQQAWREAQTALEPYWGPWLTHRGERDPSIPGDAFVMVLFRDNDQAIGRMHDWDENWQWPYGGEPHDGDIIMYRTLQPPAEARPQ